MNSDLVERVAEIIKANTRMVRGCEVKGDCPHCARDIKKAAAAVLAELAGELGDAKPNTLEREWDYSLHTNPSAQAWAEAFSKMYPTCNVRHDVMIGWFANAMMAMHDYLKGGGPINGDHAQFLQDKAIDEARHG